MNREEALAAFVHGWAITGGPLTERVRAAAREAVEIALESDDVAATIQLGSLAGLWAELYDRREKLTAHHIGEITKAWRAVTAHVPVDDMIHRLRRRLDMPAESTVDPNDKRRQQTEAAQTEAESGLHSAITSSSGTADYRAAVEAIAAGLKDGEAEGSASGVAMAAEQQGAAVVDFGLAFDDAHTALGNLGDYWGKASGWVARVVDGQATDLGNALARVARDGGDFQAMRDAASEVLDGESIRSVDTIIDMAMSQSYSRGAVSLYTREGLRTVDYVTAGGARVCPQCAEYESKNPWTTRDAPAPGWHPYCLVGDTRVQSPSPIRAASVRDYVGEIITIRTAFGHELTGTPNHPVATHRGWVPLAELCEGDHVLRSLRAEWPPHAVDPDVEDIPPTIQQVAESFPVALGPVPTAPEDFHGDGAGSDVHVVRADRFLVDHGEAPCPHHVGELQLGRGDVAVGAPFVGEGAGESLLVAGGAASTGGVGGLGETGPLLGARPGHPGHHALAPVPGLHPGGEEAATDGSSVDAEGAGERGLSFPVEVSADELGFVDRERDGLATAASLAHLNTGPHETLADRLGADPEGFADGLGAVSGGVAPDEVVVVERHGFRGHVYNLDTRDGYYIGNGILTHNCRCVLMPADPLEAIRAMNLDRYTQ